MNVRDIGAYEVTLTDVNHKRIKEVVVSNKLTVDMRTYVEQLVKDTPNAHSAYWSRIMGNLAFGAHAPKRRKDD